MIDNGTSTLLHDWITLSQELVTVINGLIQPPINQATQPHTDLNKLFQLGDKLQAFNDTFILTSSRIAESPDTRGKVTNGKITQGKAAEGHYRNNSWHELRDLVGAITDYSQLIQHQLTPVTDTAFNNDLEYVIHLCHSLLARDTEPADKINATQQLMSPKIIGTILVVDNQLQSRETLCRHLQREQHQVLRAENGQQMLDVLGSRDIDLILLNLSLPEMNTESLLKQIKQDEKLRAIPVIIVSSNRDTDRVIRCIEAGAEDYLLTPFNQALLQARINAGVERKRWHDKEQLYRVELEKNQHFIRKVFGRYLSDEIVENLLQNPEGLDLGGSQRKVSILMADIRGFTSIAEQLPPQRVVRLLNNYLGRQSEIIMQHHGTVDEFIGDAILAIFGAPVSREDDSDRALQCALEMQATMAEINQRNRDENLPEISMGISINTGSVVAGNIGSDKRAKYGVVGHTVNQVARIEEYCKPGDILISESTLDDCHSLLCIGNSQIIHARGILRDITVYQLIGIAPMADKSASPPSTQ